MKEYFDVQNLKIAWERCCRDTNRDVKDYAGIDLFGFSIEENLKNLSDILLSGEYKPSRPAKFYEPKSTGTQRTKTILCIEDAIVYQCITDKIATLAYEESNQYESFVFGSVLHPEVALGSSILKSDNPQFYFFEFWMEKWTKFADSVNNEVEDRSVSYKLETDITGFFDCIPHSKLLQLIFKKYSIDKKVVNLLNTCLNRWSGTADSTTPGVGIPQGPQASFFLANLYLTEIDSILVNKGLSYYRYMDDIRIYSSSKDELLEVLVLIDKYLKSNGLSINSKKTLIEVLSEDRDEEKIDVKDILEYLNISTVLKDLFIVEADENQLKTPLKKTNLKKSEVDLHDLGEQFGSSSSQIGQQTKEFNFKNEKEAKNYLKEELKAFDKEINTRIKIKNTVVQFKNPKQVHENPRKAQKEWLKLGYEYRSLLNLSDSLDLGYKADEKYFSVWLFISMSFIAKANQFNWILTRYPASSENKKTLFDHVEQSKLYEWVQHQFITTLAISQKLSNEELRRCFKKMKNSESFYVKLAYYNLLIHQVDESHQLYATINNSITQEKDLFLKSTLLHYIDKKNQGQLSKHDIAKTIGLL